MQMLTSQGLETTSNKVGHQVCQKTGVSHLRLKKYRNVPIRIYIM